ncbi:MAG: ABC transporter ATP-binding protein [Methanobacteriota archaeon]|nr:MAG: ABC transporter ATP-binding protein [Euryarchaeota archaeon]
MTDAVLEAEDLRVHYQTRRGPVHAVDGVSFSVREGETIGVVGETGCGKSTLGKAILGILPPRTRVEGRLQFGERNLTSLPEEPFRKIRGRDIALIFQDPVTRLDPLLTIEAHFVETIAAHEKVPRKEAVDRAVKALASMGIPESRLRHYPHEFSGGMRQRIMIAMSLVMHPKLLIADEPTTSLDVIVEAQILEILEDLRRAYKMSVVLITHNLGIVAEVCDRVAVMYAGQFVELGSVYDVFKRPIHPYTRGLLQSTIHMDSKELYSIDGLPPDLVDPPAACRFHPRCPYAKEICSTRDPEWIEYRPGHFASCHFGKDFL